MAELEMPAPPLDYATADVAPPAEESTYLGLSASAWIKIGTIAGLFVALFWPNLRRLWLKTNPFTGEPNWGHAICVPVIGLYYLYVHRDEILKAHVEPLMVARFTRIRLMSAAAFFVAGLAAYFVGPLVLSSQAESLHTAGEGLAMWGVLAAALDWGLGTMLFGLLVFGYGIWPGQNDFVKDFGMVITLFGVVLMLGGWRVMEIVWFPIVFLVCAIPWPGLVYSYIASPLQFLAAKVAVIVLQISNVGAQQYGTKIYIAGGQPLNVAEACAGLRSLMTFISVAAAVAFLSSRPLWQKIILTVSAIPIAIFCNVMRVSGQGLLNHYVSESWGEGFAHQFAGLLMLVPAFFLILLIGWILDHLLVEEMDAAATEGAAVQAKQSSAKELVVEVPRRKPAAVPAAVSSAPAPAASAPVAPVQAINKPVQRPPVSAAAPTPAAPAPVVPTPAIARPMQRPAPVAPPAAVHPPTAPTPAIAKPVQRAAPVAPPAEAPTLAAPIPAIAKPVQRAAPVAPPAIAQAPVAAPPASPKPVQRPAPLAPPRPTMAGSARDAMAPAPAVPNPPKTGASRQFGGAAKTQSPAPAPAAAPLSKHPGARPISAAGFIPPPPSVVLRPTPRPVPPPPAANPPAKPAAKSEEKP